MFCANKPECGPAAAVSGGAVEGKGRGRPGRERGEGFRF